MKTLKQFIEEDEKFRGKSDEILVNRWDYNTGSFTYAVILHSDGTWTEELLKKHS